MTKRPKCKTRGCSHRAAAKPSIKAFGYCGGCYALRRLGRAEAALVEAESVLALCTTRTFSAPEDAEVRARVRAPISEADVARVATVAIHALADVKDAQIATLIAERDELAAQVTTLTADYDRLADVVCGALDDGVVRARVRAPISEADVARVATVAIHAVADVKDAQIATLIAERDELAAQVTTLTADYDRLADDLATVDAERCAAMARVTTLTAERDEARGLLGEVLDYREGCDNVPPCNDEDEPMERAEWCKVCDMSARIAAHLGAK